MNTNKISKVITLMLVMITTMSLSALAGSSSKTYYAKAIATATGEGKVYVATANNATPSDEDFQETSEASKSGSSSNNSVNVQFYLHAQPNTSTTKFEGWFDNVDCTGNALSTANPYTATITSNSTDQNAPVTKNYYAKFVEASVFYSSTMTVAAVGADGLVSVSDDPDAEDYGTEKSASVSNTVEPAHTYYLKAKVEDATVSRFVGWYSDEECTKRLSTNASYTYKVTAESTDETDPTQFVVYAKFENIPYYYSTVTATAVGAAGKVFVATSATAEPSYQANATANNKVADKTTHSYYLKALGTSKTIFEGWYSDAECTELLSNGSDYTYSVADASDDEAAPTAAAVYAKFVEANLLQFANADFEEWETVTSGNKTCEEPVQWSSFIDATGGMKSLGANVQIQKSDDVREGATGTYSAKVFANSVVGVVAQGNLTNGCVNMGSMTATDATGNYNYTNEARADQSMRFAGRPDSVKVWVKYHGFDATYNKANMSVILTTKGYYQDPLANESKVTATKVAHASFPEIESLDEWTQYTVPFEYYTDDEPYYSLTTFSTCATPGKGNKSDYLYVDDIVMVYNSELASATFDNGDVEFTDGAATVDAYYDEDKLELISNGRAATVETSYDIQSGLLTITVKGQDYDQDPTNVHEYTIQFNKCTATLALSTAGYATFVAPFDVDELPAGVHAYTVPALKENGISLQLEEVATISANTPVLLQGPRVSRTYTGLPVDGTAVEGLLYGVYTETMAPADSYVLQNHKGVVGFYHVAEGQQHKISANRAYLSTGDNSARVLTFGEETAIQTVDALTSGKAEIYDLQGRKLNRMQKGVNIINGVKVLVK